MVNWRITATTIYCPEVDEEVTVMVYKDWSTRCTGFKKYASPAKKAARIMGRKSRQTGRQVKCNGPECSRVTRYRDKLRSEEND